MYTNGTLNVWYEGTFYDKCMCETRGIAWNFKKRLEDLDFADDTYIFHFTQLNDIQSKVKELVDLSNRVESNISKASAKRINNSSDNHIKIQDQTIGSFCYLGSIMLSPFSQHTKIRILNACINSSLLYGGENWLMSNNMHM